MKIVHSGNLKQITLLDERYYQDTKTGEFQPSATHILDVWPKGYGYHQWLKDLGSNADQVVKRAQEQGSNIHDGIEQLCLGNKISWFDGEKENYTLEEWLMILKFVEFYRTFKPEIISVEESLLSHELGFGGTLDLVCRLNGEVWYIDYKSGKAIYKTNKIQASAYRELWNGQKKEKITRAGCFHLQAMTRGIDKSGKTIQGKGWKIDEVEDFDKHFKLFKHAQAIWREENPNPKPKNEVYESEVSIL